MFGRRNFVLDRERAILRGMVKSGGVQLDAITNALVYGDTAIFRITSDSDCYCR